MRVSVHPEVFGTGLRSQLGRLCGYGLEQRHRIQLLDEEHTDWLNFFDSRDELERLEWQECLRYGSRDDGLHPSAHEIEVIAEDASAWDRPIPRLALRDAVDLLAQPFQVILEGDAEDWDFLLRMSTPEQEELLETFLESGAVEHVNGGGLPSIVKRAKKESRVPGVGLRRWYLFDSDGLFPGDESSKSRELRELCKPGSTVVLPFYQLKRRMIENYLPLSSLNRWANELPPKKRKQRTEIYGAFRALGTHHNSQAPLRHFYNLKEGFKRARDQEALKLHFGELLQEEKKRDLEALKSGFGKDIGRLFQDPRSVPEEALRRDGGWQELNPEISRLIARIR